MEQRRNKTCDGDSSMREVENGKQIGQGGNAKVYLGVSEKTGEPCVVKRAVRQKAAFMQLANEAEILGYLADAGYEHAPVLYSYSGNELVMEYIDGQTLDEMSLLEYSESNLKILFADILEAVRQLHELGNPVIHRDIKPSNILAGKDGKIHLIDFGTAGIMKGYENTEGSRRSCGMIKGAGTKKYAAPEQYGGLLEECFATDIYQLGKTMDFLVERADVSPEFRKGIDLIAGKCCAPCATDRYLRISEIEAELFRVKARKKRQGIFMKISSLKKHKVKSHEKRKNAEKSAAFIDIVRTFDTIEFL